MEKLTLRTQDGVDINVYLTPSELEGNTDQAILIAPALGVPAKFYDQFATYFAKCGFDVFTLDYRTVGPSGSEFPRLLDAGGHDLDTAIEYLAKKYRKVSYVGHSLGGQLLGLARSANKLDCSVFIASSIPDTRNMVFKLRWQTRALKYFLLPFYRDKGLFPSRKLGLSSLDLPASIANDWGRWLRSRSYLFDHLTDEQLSCYRQVKIRILSSGFSDDDMAPQKNLEKLLAQYPSAAISRSFHHIGSLESPCGHLGFFKESSGAAYWPEVVRWLESKSEGQEDG